MPWVFFNTNTYKSDVISKASLAEAELQHALKNSSDILEDKIFSKPELVAILRN